MSEFNLDGLDDVLKNFKNVSDAVKLKATRSALQSAASIVVKSARQNALRIDDPTTSNNISKNISKQFLKKRYKRTGDLVVRIGVRGGAKKKKNTTWYWRLLELGTSRIAARPFLRPALSSNVQRVTSEFSKLLERSIKKNLKK